MKVYEMKDADDTDAPLDKGGTGGIAPSPSKAKSNPPKSPFIKGDREA
jgi:hypothetical protein